MATLTAVVVPAKALKNGKHKVRISVAHNGETRYIVTDIVIDSIKQFKNGAVTNRPDAAWMNTRLRSELQKYQKAIDNLDYVNCLTCPELICKLKEASEIKRLTLHMAFEEYLMACKCKPQSIAIYRHTCIKLNRFLKKDIILELINDKVVMNFEKYLHGLKLSNSTINRHMSVFRSVINFAKKHGYVRYIIDPFEFYKAPVSTIRQSWLTVDEVRLIRDFKTTNPRLIKCRDIFMLSYYLGGINIVDLVKINFNKNIPHLKYVRTKTQDGPKANKYVEFDVPIEARQIIEKYKKGDGFLDFGYDESRRRLSMFVCNHTPKLGANIGLEHLIYYAARKSFSQHAFNLGISTSIIDYILGHRVDKVSTSLFSYISVTPIMATNSIRQVLDNLRK